MLGTAKYLSPEQVAGKPVDGRADLYSLGVVLYECLAGAVPFTAEDDEATARARLEADAPPVRARRPGTPRPLAELVTALLARDPGKRPATAAMVADRLERMAWGLSDDVSAVPVEPSKDAPEDPDATPTVAGPPVPSSHRRWVVAALSIVLIAAALAAIGIVTGTRNGAPPSGASAGTVANSTTAPGPNATTAVPALPVAIAGIAEFDPEPLGDGKENPRRLGNLTDGDAATSWATVCYQTASFAPKQGVGLVLELSRAPNGATLAVETGMVGWSVQVFEAERAAERLSDWGSSVGGGSAVEGNLRVQLTSRSGRYVLVLLTRAPRAQRCSKDNPYAGEVTGLRVDP